MELQIKLSLLRGNKLPINYQYELSAWIYKVIERANAEYSDFLHNKGFQHAGKQFRMFTFSQLDARPYEILGSEIKLLGKEISFILRFAGGFNAVMNYLFFFCASAASFILRIASLWLSGVDFLRSSRITSLGSLFSAKGFNGNSLTSCFIIHPNINFKLLGNLKH